MRCVLNAGIHSIEKSEDNVRHLGDDTNAYGLTDLKLTIANACYKFTKRFEVHFLKIKKEPLALVKIEYRHFPL